MRRERAAAYTLGVALWIGFLSLPVLLVANLWVWL